ncbi:MAG: hypothetical protein HGA22_03930 [Clostridiales bacterium]|nr:hypothetical protein [Clostridiales bacterium]
MDSKVSNTAGMELLQYMKVAETVNGRQGTSSVPKKQYTGAKVKMKVSGRSPYATASAVTSASSGSAATSGSGMASGLVTPDVSGDNVYRETKPVTAAAPTVSAPAAQQDKAVMKASASPTRQKTSSGLRFSSNDLVNGIILSEVLGSPKARIRKQQKRQFGIGR